MLERIQDRVISPSVSLLEAMKLMDALSVKTLFIFSGDKFEGLLTLGDIQRAIIKNASLSESACSVLDNS